MSKRVIPLINKQLKEAKPREQDYSLCDGNNLYFRVRKNGTKHWNFIYTSPITKRRKYLSFGCYPYISLSEARKLTLDAKTLLFIGIDPMIHREEKKHENKRLFEQTFSTVSEHWLEKKQNTHKCSKKYIKKMRTLLRLHLLPKLKDIPIAKIKSSDVISALEKTYNKNQLTTVHRACTVAKDIVLHAEHHNFIKNSENQLTGLNKYYQKPKVTHYPTIRPEELPILVLDIKKANCTYTIMNALLWSLHTMCRPAECADAEWSHIDFQKKQWVLPAEKMKNSKEHIVPLTKQTLAILEEMRKFNGDSKYIFNSPIYPNKPISSQSCNSALKDMGYKDRLVSHGMRSISSTILNNKQYNADAIETALSHIDKNQTRGAYNNADYLETRIEMMQWWSDHIDGNNV